MQPPMHQGLYLLTEQIVAIVNQEGRKSMTVLKEGQTLSLISETYPDTRFVMVAWMGTPALVFKNDFEQRTHVVMG